MIVDRVRLEERDDDVRLVADVSWEDRHRDSRELWYAVPAEYATAMRPRADAFLVGCAVLAQHHGERRLRLTGDTCPRLVEGMRTALAWLRQWYHRDRPELRVEAPLDSDAGPPASYRSGLFLSGGLDSLYTLYRNHHDVPAGHPHRFGVGVVVDGIEEYRSTRFHRAIHGIAEATGLEVVRPSTNLRSLDPDGAFWRAQWYGAALASVAHALGGLLSEVTISSSHWVGEQGLEPLGSHPLVDPAFSSQTLQVLHASVGMGRVARLRAIAHWDVARRYLRVCNTDAGESLNCGRCHKCLMIMLTLVALGQLAEFPSFPDDDLRGELIAGLRLFTRGDIDPYLPLVPDLEAAGRDDLADALRHLDEDFHPWGEWRELALADINAALPDAAPFLLADEGYLGTPDTVHGRPRVQLWDPAADDAAGALVSELGRHATAGLRHLVIAWPSSWWLDVYGELGSWLGSTQRLLLRTERVSVYELRDPAR